MGDRSPQVFHVPPDLPPQSLGSILRRWLADESWAQIRKLVQTRRILVDGNLAVDLGQRLKAGQVVKLLGNSLPPPATENDVHVCHIDADVVVVDKPSGMTSVRHPEERLWPARRRQQQPTLTEVLPRLLARIDRNQGHQARPRALRAVHRLDRETSGLMVFARNVRAESFLGQQFRAHSIRRVYWAIVAGQVAEQSIETNLIRDRGDGRRGSTPREDIGKRAVTHVRPLEHLPGFTLVECRLETGRTHQIRIHLAEIGHPVCGDKVYATAPRRGGMRAGSDPARLALHAGQLGFLHPADNRLLDFESPLPRDLETYLNLLRGGASARGKPAPPRPGGAEP